MNRAKKLLGFMLLIGFTGFLVTSVLADSPSVTVLPATIPPGGTVTITITAAVSNTVVSSISAEGPSDNPGPWSYSGFTIELPDAGDAVSITFPGGILTVASDTDGDVTAVTGTWTAGANTDKTGSYFVTVTGTETSTVTKSFTVSQEFNVPEFVIGTAIVTSLGFSGLLMARRRFKKL
jgi:hypothetical protein